MIFWCGYQLSFFAAFLFNEKSVKWTKCVSSANDILVYGDRGPCSCNPKTFKGRILAVNGEDFLLEKYTSRTFQIGAGGYKFPYGAVVWIDQQYKQYNGKLKYNAVAYANSNCVKERERIAEELASVVTVHALGRCNAKGKAINKFNPGHWMSNVEKLKGYPFVLAAEHGISNAYVTEKPFVAAAAGAIPIYWGSGLIKRFMNTDRVLIYNSSTSQIVKRLLEKKQELLHVRTLGAINNSQLAEYVTKMLKAFYSI